MTTSTTPTHIYRDRDEVSDRVKYHFAKATSLLADLQYRVAELAGISKLDPEESMRLQDALHETWEMVYWGTACTVRELDDDSPDWGASDNIYSDGTVVATTVIEDPGADRAWEHNPFLLGDGAVRDRPRGSNHLPCPTAGARRRQRVTTEGGRARYLQAVAVRRLTVCLSAPTCSKTSFRSFTSTSRRVPRSSGRRRGIFRPRCGSAFRASAGALTGAVGLQQCRKQEPTTRMGGVGLSAEGLMGDTTYSLQEEHFGPVVDGGQRRVED